MTYQSVGKELDDIVVGVSFYRLREKFEKIEKKNLTKKNRLVRLMILLLFNF